MRTLLRALTGLAVAALLAVPLPARAGVITAYTALEEDDVKVYLDAFAKEVPDVILLDLAMPVMDGMTFLDRLRNDPYHAGLPVIVLTSRDLSDEEMEVLEEKASSVILKSEELEERLHEVLGSLFPISAS